MNSCDICGGPCLVDKVNHQTPKFEDMPIGVPFLVKRKDAPIETAGPCIRVEMGYWTWMWGDCEGIQLNDFENREWSDEVEITDWFDLSLTKEEPKQCCCDIVALMQGGCRCGGK